MSVNLLTVNLGSSSVKLSLHVDRQNESRVQRWDHEIECTNNGNPHGKETPTEQSGGFQKPVDQLFEWLNTRISVNEITAVGHRIVHGGPFYRESVWIDQDVLQHLESCIPLAPNHLPGEIALIRQLQCRLPHVAQAACFDTAFHADLPRVASMLPLPRVLQQGPLRRYGFHGLSYAYLLKELETLAGEQVPQGRVIFAHLGNGASMAAVHHGKCIDTSMSLTPTAGLVMGTRTGDLDPGVLIYLLRENYLTTAQLDHLVTRESGLLGLSETSSDMRALLQHRDTDIRAAEAVSLFCYQAKKYLGAYAAALGGLDTVVFSGGVGEHASPVREEICSGLNELGIELDAERNQANAKIISSPQSRVTVYVIPTDEELMIARELKHMLLDRSST